MNIAQLLLAPARRHPGATALAGGERPLLSYGELALRVVRLAGGIRSRLGLVAGERVAVFMHNHPLYYEILFALWQAGLVAVPVNAKLHPRELAWILQDCGARACFTLGAVDGVASLDVTSPEFGRLYAEDAATGTHPAEVRPEDPAWLFYTSGTTGTPKGAVLTHRNLLFMVQAYFCDIDRLGTGDAILHAAPLSHGSGLYGLAHFAAGAVNVIPDSGGFEAAEIFRLCEAWNGVSFFAAPTMVVRLLASPEARPMPRLKTIVYGGAPMYVSDAQRAIDLFGPHLYQLYGQGESPMTITGLPQSCHTAGADAARLASCGHARTGVEVRIVDEGDRELPPGEVGEVLTRSDCVMSGYWNNPRASAQALRGGWLHTGDLGSLDGQGFLTLQDRSKDLIISGGSNIYPREVEEVLLRHPGVAECSVVGRPHPEWGEEVIAFVVARAGIAAPSAELDALCLDHIARFKRPKEYRFVDALPKNNYGKVLKTELRRLL